MPAKPPAALHEPRPFFDPEGQCSCGGQAVARVNRETRQVFWGCSRFPRCRNTTNSAASSDHEGHDCRTSASHRGATQPLIVVAVVVSVAAYAKHSPLAQRDGSDEETAAAIRLGRAILAVLEAATPEKEKNYEG